MTVYPTSVVPSVRSYLLDLFTAAVAPFDRPPVEVFLSQPTVDTQNDIVVIGGAHRETPKNAMVGTGGQFWQMEMFTIEAEIACYVAGNDVDNNPFEAVDQRAYEILQALETAIRKDPSGGGRVIVMSPDSSTSTHEWEDGGQGALCNITLVVAVQASY